MSRRSQWFASWLQALDARAPALSLLLMIEDADSFEIRIGKPRSARGGRLGPLKGAIGRAVRGRREAAATAHTGVRPHFRKGADKRSAHVSLASRRVVVKARFVNHAVIGAGALKAHVAYLAREGSNKAATDGRTPELAREVDYLSREAGGGEPRYAFYNGAGEDVNGKALASSWAGDKRHFRLIVSPEDGSALGDLKPFVRELMGDLEQRLGTRLDWAAVDHWDTDNPHSHILIRGRRADGTDLVIPRKVIAFEIRERAQAIVTRVLGPRPALGAEINRARAIEMPGLTPLDREIQRAAADGVVDVSRRRRPDLLARLERLESWGLARRRGDGGWRIGNGLEGDLRTMGERAEARELLNQADLMDPAYDILAAGHDRPTLGRLVHAGVADELSGRTLFVLEDGAGVRRFASFAREDDLAALVDAPRGAVVEFVPREARLRPADQAISRIAGQTGGLYSADLHKRLEPNADPALLTANMRRLEAIRRAGRVERRSDGVFEITPDYLGRALAFEQRRLMQAPLQPGVVSWLTLVEQEQAMGLTQLDRVLAGHAERPRGHGRFVEDYEASLQRRRQFLIEEGVMGPNEARLSQSGASRLTARELDATAQRLSRELGMPVLVGQGDRVKGVYARRIDLAQGRMAVLVSEHSARLVPWRPALERFAGREVEVMARGQSLSFGLVNARGIEIS